MYQRNLDKREELAGRRGAIAQRVVDRLLEELGITQPELPWGLAPALRPQSYDEVYHDGADGTNAAQVMADRQHRAAA